MALTQSDKMYQAQDDLRVLKNHQEIVSDSKRLAAAKALATKEVAKLQKIKSPTAVRRKVR